MQVILELIQASSEVAIVSSPYYYGESSVQQNCNFLLLLATEPPYLYLHLYFLLEEGAVQEKWADI